MRPPCLATPGLVGGAARRAAELILPLIMFALAGCVAVVTTRPASGVGGQVFAISNEQADAIIQEALHDLYPDLNPVSVEGPRPGFTVSTKGILGTERVTITRAAALGLAPNGDHVAGFTFAVDFVAGNPSAAAPRAQEILDYVVALARRRVPPFPLAP